MSIVALADFKTFIHNEITSADNTDLQLALDTGDRIIHGICHRQFVAAGSASNRTYVPEVHCLLGLDVLSIHDCSSVTSVTENGTVLVAGTDYQAEPVNLVNDAGETEPVTQLRRFSGTWYRDDRKGTVVVNAAWGWPSAIPEPIKGVARIIAKDVAKHRDVDAGLVGVDALGAAVLARVPPLVRLVLTQYTRFDRIGIA